MKESQFINQNKEKWQEAEKLIAAKEKDTDRLSSLFIHLTDDLSYARTFFPHRFINVYLNQTSMKFFSLIYKRKKGRFENFRSFWKDELPQVVIHCRKELLISLLVFILSVVIGVVSSIHDPEFASSILGDEYIQMTKKNIESGDPMAVYKAAQPTDMFLSITLNNIYVAFRTYLFGLLLGIGTFGSLLYNGIMLGVFQYFFYERKLLGTSMLAVWLHGTLEISSIIIAGGAGLTLARGIVLPGALSRTQSFYRSATRSLKLLLGTVPIFIFAAFIESFITRFTEIPGIIRLAFILISLFFIIGYFVVYPYVKSRKGFDKPIQEPKLTAGRREPLNFSSLKNNADLFKDAFYLYFENIGRLSFLVFLSSASIVAAYYFISQKRAVMPEDMDVFNLWLKNIVSDAFALFNYHGYRQMSACALVTALLLFSINHLVYRQARPGTKLNAAYFVLGITNSLIISFLLHFLVLSASSWGILLFSLLFPLGVLLNYMAHDQRTFFIMEIGRLFNFFGSGAGQLILLFASMVLTSFLFTLLLNSPLLYLYWEMIRMNLPPDLKYITQILEFATTAISGFVLLSVLSFNAIALGLLFYSANEAITAEDLLQKVRSLKIA